MLLALLAIAGLLSLWLWQRQQPPRNAAAWLLAPVCPVLGWGPLTHCYLNHRARERFLATDPPADHPVAKLLRTPAGSLGYVQHSIDPDVIKTYGFMYKTLEFEYAHNPLPNRYTGRPLFGEALWQAARTPGEQLLALGWLSHQIADQFAHNLPVDRFYGYVNREAYFGYYWDEVMHHLGLPYHEALGGAFYTADHWVTELIVDTWCCADLGAAYDRRWLLGRRALPIELAVRIAPAYLQEHQAVLAADYAVPQVPLRTAPLKRCREFADMVNAGTAHYVQALAQESGGAAFCARVEGDSKFGHVRQMLDLVVEQLAGMLQDPAAGYQPIPVTTADLLPVASRNGHAPAPLTDDAPGWWSPAYVEAVKAYHPRKPGLMHRMLQIAPLGLMRWVMATVPLTSLKGPLAEKCLPRGYNNLSLAMRFAWQLREGGWDSFSEAMEQTLTAKGLLGPARERQRLRTY